MCFLSLLFLAVSCSRSETDRNPANGTAAQSTNRQVFAVKGVVQEVKPRQREVVIKHEEIPGYMPAMTMPFEVKNTNELTGLAPGLSVSFRLVVTDTDGWIEGIQKIDRPATNQPAVDSSTLVSGHTRLARDVEPLNPGDPLPVYSFTNQSGQAISTAQFKGQALAITFLFTRCPLPNFCPLMANNFSEVQAKLLGKSSAPTNWHLLTISFDPAFDTPAVLKAYAEAHRYDPKHWTFATGMLIDVTAIAEQFGLMFWRDETGSISHNLRTVVIDRSGRLQRVLEGNKWTSDELVEELIKAAGK